jgi:hypothetical protein
MFTHILYAHVRYYRPITERAICKSYDGDIDGILLTTKEESGAILLKKASENASSRSLYSSSRCL